MGLAVMTTFSPNAVPVVGLGVCFLGCAPDGIVSVPARLASRTSGTVTVNLLNLKARMVSLLLTHRQTIPNHCPAGYYRPDVDYLIPAR